MRGLVGTLALWLLTAAASAQRPEYPLFPASLSEQSHQLDITVTADGRAHGLHRLRIRNAPRSGVVEGCFFLHAPPNAELESLEVCRSGACRSAIPADLSDAVWALALTAPLSSSGRPIARAESDLRGVIRVCAAPISDTVDLEVRLGWVAPLVINRGHATLVIPARLAGAPDGRLVRTTLRATAPGGIEIHAPPFARITRATRIEIAGLAPPQSPTIATSPFRQTLVALRPRDVASSIKLELGAPWRAREGAGLPAPTPGVAAPALGYVRPPDPRTARIGNAVPGLSGWTRLGVAPMGLGTDTLRRLMGQIVPYVVSCVAAEQRADPQWRPSAFRALLRDGVVAEITIGDAPSPRLDLCLTGVARAAMLPSFSGTILVNYPMPDAAPPPEVETDPSLPADVAVTLDDALRAPLPARPR